MRLKALLTMCGILIFSLCFGVTGVFAGTPSLSANNQLMLSVEADYGEQAFKLFRDGKDSETFYYVPTNPTIAVEMENGKPSPIFKLLNDPKGNGGVLHVSIAHSASKETVEKLKTALLSRLPSDIKTPRFVPLPIENIKLTLFDPRGEMLDQVAANGDEVPTFEKNNFPFSIRLEKIRNDLVKALTNKEQGLPVLLSYNFNCLSPTTDLDLEIDWDACYKYFEKDKKFAAEVAKRFISGSFGPDLATLRNSFVSNGLIKFNQSDKEKVEANLLDELMFFILTRITDELYETIRPPASIPSPDAKIFKKSTQENSGGRVGSEAAMNATGHFFQEGIKVEYKLKNRLKIKKGKESISFDRGKIFSTTISFGELIGIGHFPKEIQDKCFGT
ncbi:MAG: hypothetical protein ACOYXC_01045, partial [Candidatus Rifleibacteriota bacterium]